MQSKKIKILAIIPSGFCFGLQNVTLDLFQGFSTQVEAIFLISKWGDGEFKKKLQALEIPFKATWIGFFSKSFKLAYLKMTFECFIKLPVAYVEFFKLLVTKKPNILFFANNHELILFLPVLALLKLFRLPVICHMHDPAPVSPFQKLSFFVYDIFVSSYVCISTSVRDRMIALGAQPKKLKIISNGIKIAPKRPLERKRKVFTIGITGQMSSYKGHEDFVLAAKILTDRKLDFKYLIGGKTTPFKAELEQLIEKHELENRVTFTGWMESPNDFYQQIDILTVLTKTEEGFGLVAIEAMQSGIPVIATKSGGLLDIITDGATGLLVEKSSPIQVADAIYQLYEDKDMYNKLAEAGGEEVSKRFSLELMTKNMEYHLKSFIK